MGKMDDKKMGGFDGLGDMKMKMYKKMGGLGGFGSMKMKKYKKMGGLGGFGSAEGSAESMGPLAGARLTGSEMGMGGFDGDMKMKMYKKMGGLGGFGSAEGSSELDGSDEAFGAGARLSGDENQMASVEAQMSDEGVSSGEGSAESMGPLVGAMLTSSSGESPSGSGESPSGSGESPSGSAEFNSSAE